MDLTVLDIRWPLLFFPGTDFIDNDLHIVKKKFKTSVHGMSNPAILRLEGAWNYGS